MVTESGTNGWPSCEVIILLLIWPLLMSEAALAKKMKEGEESWGEHKQPLRLLGRPCFTYENTIFHAANFHLIWKACHASTMPFMRYKKVPHPGKSLQFLSTYKKMIWIQILLALRLHQWMYFPFINCTYNYSQFLHIVHAPCIRVAHLSDFLILNIRKKFWEM